MVGWQFITCRPCIVSNVGMKDSVDWGQFCSVTDAVMVAVYVGR